MWIRSRRLRRKRPLWFGSQSERFSTGKGISVADPRSDGLQTCRLNLGTLSDAMLPATVSMIPAHKSNRTMFASRSFGLIRWATLELEALHGFVMASWPLGHGPGTSLHRRPQWT
jgi:hypothetical protein